MSFVLDDVIVRVAVDSAGAPEAGHAVTQALRRVGDQAHSSEQKLRASNKATSLTTQELRALNYAVSDTVSSLASGISPMTILLQQGPQVRDAFGGVGNALSKVSASMTVARVAGLGLAGVAAVLGVAYYSAWKEQRAFDDALAVTGKYAGMTAGRFDELAERISRLDARPIGEVRDALQALVASGAFGPQSVDAAVTAAVKVQAFTGRTAEQVAKDFAAMSRGVAQWAAEHNRQYNFITAAQYAYIRALEAEGRAQEAMAFTLQALNDKFANQTRNLGYLEQTIKEVKEEWSSFWNTVKGVGRDESLDDKIKAARERLITLRGAPLAFTSDFDAARALFDSDFRRRLAAQNLAEHEQRLLTLNRERFREQDRTTSAAYELQRQQEEIEKLSAGYQNTVLGRDRAFFSRRQAQEAYAREQERLATERQFQRLEITQQEYRARNEARAKADMASKLRAVEQELALERRLVPEKPQDRIAKESRLADLEARRLGLLQQQQQVEADIAAGKYAGAPRDVRESPTAAFRQLELSQGAAINQALEERRAQALRSAAELQEINHATNIALIRDDRERGLTQIRLEEDQLRKRLDLGALFAREQELREQLRGIEVNGQQVELLSGDARRRAEEELRGLIQQRQEAEESFAQWRVLRERQLTEQLMPEWQRQLELYADTTRYMREASDEFHKGFIDNGRSAFEEWVTTGQLSTKRLTQFIEQQFAKMFYDRYLSSFVNSVGDSIFSMVLGSTVASGNGAGTITGGSGLQVPTHHQGGIAGAGMPTRTVSPMHFAQARRYHGGGIAGDEVPAVLRRGEEVLTRGDPRHVLNDGQAGMNVTIAPVINGGVSRNELINGMALAADLAVNRVADARRRGNRRFIDER